MRSVCLHFEKDEFNLEFSEQFSDFVESLVFRNFDGVYTLLESLFTKYLTTAPSKWYSATLQEYSCPDSWIILRDYSRSDALLGLKRAGLCFFNFVSGLDRVLKLK